MLNSSDQRKLIQQVQQCDNVGDAVRQNFVELISTNRNCLVRESVSAHLTASALVYAPDNKDRVLLVKHQKLGRWLQPGGHADGNPDLLAVALQEVREETGLTTSVLSQGVFTLDRHYIPEHQAVLAHWHYDFLYLMQADSGSDLLLSDESSDLAWWNIEDLNEECADRALLQAVQKSQELFFR